MTFISVRLFLRLLITGFQATNNVIAARAEFSADVTSHPLLILGSKFASAGKKRSAQVLYKEDYPVRHRWRSVTAAQPRQVRRLHFITNGITTTMELLRGNLIFFLIVISEYWTCSTFHHNSLAQRSTCSRCDSRGISISFRRLE